MLRRILSWKFLRIATACCIICGYVTYATVCSCIRANYGSVAARKVEIGNALMPLQVTAHELLTRWDAVHGKEPPKEEDPDRRATIESCAKVELVKNTWFKWLPVGQRASLQEAIVQLNMERQPRIPKVDVSKFEIPKVEVPGFGSLFSSKK